MTFLHQTPFDEPRSEPAIVPVEADPAWLIHLRMMATAASLGAIIATPLVGLLWLAVREGWL